MFAGNFAPHGWFLCHGQLLSIAQYPPLFSLLGTTYGGNGTNNFALPDLRGRVPTGAGTTVHGGKHYFPGETGGNESITLTHAQLPHHTHALFATPDAADVSKPIGNALGMAPIYATKAPAVPLHVGSIGTQGASQPFDVRQPYLAVNFIIAFIGIFPTRG